MQLEIHLRPTKPHLPYGITPTRVTRHGLMTA